jgi:hypothetical protein
MDNVLLERETLPAVILGPFQSDAHSVRHKMFAAGPAGGRRLFPQRAGAARGHGAGGARPDPLLCEERCRHPHHERPQKAERVDGADDADATPPLCRAC